MRAAPARAGGPARLPGLTRIRVVVCDEASFNG